MLASGDVVLAEFFGVVEDKIRPCVVVSTDIYHRTRPDALLCVLTTNVAMATAPSDYILQDWAAAGLHQPSVFRSFFNTTPRTRIKVIGHLSDRDWLEVQARLRVAVAVA